MTIARGLRGAVTVALVLIVVSTAPAQYSGGSGTAQDPYQIATAADLIALGETPADYDKHFILTADIDLDPNLPGNSVFDRPLIAPDTNDTARGFQGVAFVGVIDGQGHAIEHMVIDSNVAYAGLFGMIGSGGYVANLRLIDVLVRGQVSTYDTRGGVEGGAGALAGVNQGLVTNCCNTGSVNGNGNVGGLVGHNNYGTISGSCNTGSVRSADLYSGGLAGANHGVILACYSEGAVNSTRYAGGLIGDNRGTICACCSSGSVNGVGSGGLVGSNSGAISACYSAGKTGSTDAGGLAGSNIGTISACLWDIETSGQTRSAGGVGLTTSQMVATRTFVDAGWDFAGESANGLCEYWQMPAGGGYPVLSIFNGQIPHALQGTGTSGDPYLVRMGEDLGMIWRNPSAFYQLAADIDLSGVRWGMAVIPGFSGRLDGNGHRIAGMTIAGGGHLGLIGLLSSGAAVTDLRLEDVNNVGTGDCVGSLVGRNDGGRVSTCHSAGSVSGRQYVGGLAGWSRYGTISDCSNMSSVSGTNWYIGGLVGYSYFETLSGCCNMGSVSVDKRNYFVGGLVGHNDGGAISACCTMGSVSGGKDSHYVGGLVGFSSGGTISACWGTASVRGYDTVGGLVGANQGVISTCHCTGSVTGMWWCVGGLVGGNEGEVSDCYSTGPVDGCYLVGGLVGENFSGIVSNSNSTGPVSGTAQEVGGLAGRNDYGGEILASYSASPVNGASGNTGGLVGFNRSATILACYSTGPVDGNDCAGGLVAENCNGAICACYSTSSVNANKDAGGLVGCNLYGVISACYSTGSVTGSTCIGGLVGANVGAISACFWDVETSGQVLSSAGAGLPTSKMVVVRTFIDAGWDFVGERANGLSEFWQMPAGGGYPVLSVFNGYVPRVLQNTGTSNDPYLLKTGDDLGSVWYHPAACYQLAADIDLSGIKWGMSVIPAFYGSLDGQGHSIVGARITGGGYLGLIGSLRGGTVTSLGLVDGNCVGTGDYVGALVGYNNRGTISNCHSTGTVRGKRFAAGLVGYTYGGTFSACYSTGAVSGMSYVAGLAGYTHGGTFSASYSTVTVSATGDYVGGLVGLQGNGEIEACTASGWVRGNNSVGGLVGEIDSHAMISACYSEGSVFGSKYVGGLAGRSTYSAISACYSTGSVAGSTYVGGLVGSNDIGTISASFWDAQTSGRADSAGGTEKATAEMKIAETFLEAGWDFVGETANGTEDVWWIEEGKDYPRLWWEPRRPVRLPVVELDAAGFEAGIARGVVLVDFYATWCSHCTTQAPILEEVAYRLEGRARVAKLDVDKARGIVQRYNVTAVPTLILFREGVEVKRFVGVTGADVLVAAVLEAAGSL